MNAAEREKLAAILGMLGSEFPGERAAAGLAATRFLKDRKLQWQDVLNGTPFRAAPPPPPPPPSRPPPPDFGTPFVGKDGLWHIGGAVLRQTEKAWLFTTGDGDECWLPKSQCVWSPGVNDMAVPEWLAREKDLIV